MIVPADSLVETFDEVFDEDRAAMQPRACRENFLASLVVGSAALRA